MKLMLDLGRYTRQLSEHKCRESGGAETEGMVKQWPTKVEIFPKDKYQSMTLLMILCYILSPETSIIIIKETRKL